MIIFPKLTLTFLYKIQKNYKTGKCWEMGKSDRFYSQNSNQPLEADFSLEEQMIPRVQSIYDFGTSLGKKY